MSVLNTLFDPILELFGSSAPDPVIARDDPFVGLITYVRSLIFREDLLEPYIAEYDEILRSPQTEATARFLHLYISLEELILANKPPIIKNAYTKQSLREEIAQHVPLDKMPPLLYVLFLTGINQRLYLYMLVFKPIYDFIVEHLGSDTADAYVMELIKSTVLENMRDLEHPHTYTIPKQLYGIDPQELRFSWLRLFNGLYEKLVASLGEKLVTVRFEQIYESVKKCNDYEVILELVEVFPKEITQKDRLQYLSRVELEKKVLEATTQEKEKRMIIEKLARDLQEKVQDLHKSNMNILAYEKALEESKMTTERQVEERTKQLKESQDRLFKFLERIPVGVYVFDRAGAPYYANAELKHMIGGGTHDFSKLEPIIRAYRGESSSARNVEFSNAERHLQLEVVASPIFDSGGHVEYVIAAFHDITEDIVLERSKDEFFSIASHELRTPLTAIRGYAWILKDEYGKKLNDPDFDTILNDIYSSSVRLIGLVNDFLNMSRLEQGRMVFKNEVFDLSGLVDELVAEYKIPATEKGLFLRRGDPNPTPSMVEADRGKVKETLINFIGNALKFTHQGGITIYLVRELNQYVVRVEDTGPGIDRENQALLFRKFQQAGKNIYARDISQGSGLGLYISKLMMQGMGGSIGLERSEPGRGSVFFLSLPLAKE